MFDNDAEEYIRRQSYLESDRAVWEQHWREIADLVLPRQRGFNEQLTPGEKQLDKVFDGTPELALNRFASAMESFITPRTQRWAKLQAMTPDLNEDLEVRRYFDELNESLFRYRYVPRANFQSQMHENYMSLGAFGTGAVFVDDVVGAGLMYRAIHLNELYLCEDFSGRVDTVHRKFQFTARQAAQSFGVDKLPDKIKSVLERQPEQKFWFLHCVAPNEAYMPGDIHRDRMKYSSVYLSIDDRTIVSRGGYRTMPYAVSRYVKGPNEIYGRSPAMSALPDIKMLQEIEKSVIRQANRITDPPLLLTDDGSLRGFSVRPNALNFGGLDEQGRPRVVPFNPGARIDVGIEIADGKRLQVNDHFLVTLFQILVDTPNMTATEALIRAQEKGQLAGPIMGRQQSELIGTIIEREIDVLAHRPGALPQMPKALRDAGGEYAIEYTSPLNRAMRAEDGVAIMRTMEAITPWAQVDPTVLDVFDPEAIVRELGDVNGIPAKVLRDEAAVAAIRANRQTQLQAQQLMQAAPIAAQSAKTLAEASALQG